MRPFRSHRAPVPAPAVEPKPQPDVEELRAQLVPLAEQAGRLGYQLLPLGAWEETVGRLERERDAALTQLEAVRAHLEAVVERERNMVDGTALMRELAHLAGVELPRVADRAIELGRENMELRQRAYASEAVAGALIDDAINRFQNTDSKDSQ